MTLYKILFKNDKKAVLDFGPTEVYLFHTLQGKEAHMKFIWEYVEGHYCFCLVGCCNDTSDKVLFGSGVLEEGTNECNSQYGYFILVHCAMILFGNIIQKPLQQYQWNFVQLFIYTDESSKLIFEHLFYYNLELWDFIHEKQ